MNVLTCSLSSHASLEGIHDATAHWHWQLGASGQADYSMKCTRRQGRVLFCKQISNKHDSSCPFRYVVQQPTAQAGLLAAGRQNLAAHRCWSNCRIC